jgi:hypothetical protein
VNGRRGQKAQAGKKATTQKKPDKASTVAVLEEEADESETTESAPSLFAAFEGGGSPEALEKALDAKVDDIDSDLTKLRSTYAAITNDAAVKGAQKALAAIQSKLSALEVFAEAFAGKREAIDALMSSDELMDSDDMTALLDRATEIEKELGGVARKAAAETARLSEEVTEQVGRIGLAEDDLNASNADKAELNRLRGLWASVALAKGHFTKHESDTHATSEVDYLTRAEALNNKKAGGTVLRKTRSDGDTCTFDTSTGDFSVMSSAGKIRTFFRPSRGKKYYDEQ